VHRPNFNFLALSSRITVALLQLNDAMRFTLRVEILA